MTRRHTSISILVLAIVPLFFIGPALIPGHALLPLDLKNDLGAWKADPTLRLPVSNRLLSDVVLQFYPWDVEARRLIRAGEMPWRNQYAGDGGPLWANPQTALLSPFTTPRLLMGARGWAFAVYLKFFVAGLGVFLLLRRLEFSPFIATICGVVYMCSGYSVLYALHPHTNVFAIMPLLAAAALAFLQQPSPGRALWVAIIAAIATAGGHPETLFIGIIAIAVLLIIVARAPKMVWARLALSALAGFLLLGVSLVPFAKIALESEFASARPNAPAGAFRLIALPGQLLPGFLGTPIADELDLTGAIPNAENMNLRSGAFIGALALLTILLGIPDMTQRQRILLFCAIAFLFLSLRPPLVTPLLKNIPIVSVVEPAYFALAFTILALIPLAAALQSLQQRTTTRRLGIVVLVIALLAAIGSAILAAPFTRPLTMSIAKQGIARLQARGHLQHSTAVYEQRLDGYLEGGRMLFFRRFFAPALTWALAGAALISLRRRTALLGLAIALEMIAFGWHLLPVTRLNAVPHAPPPAIAGILAADPARQWSIAAPTALYPANLGTTDRVRQAESFDVLQSRDRVAALARAGFDPVLGFPDTPRDEHLDGLRELGVRFYVTPTGVVEIANARPSPLPANAPPIGLRAGIFTSFTGAILAIAVALSLRGHNSGPSMHTAQ